MIITLYRSEIGLHPFGCELHFALDTNTVGTFDITESGTYYCKMTNGLFPRLTLITANIIKTSIPNIVKSSGLQVYHNPSNGQVKIQLGTDMSEAEITIFSITGRQVYEQKMTDLREVTINLSDLHAAFTSFR